jgi:hypothetical protein
VVQPSAFDLTPLLLLLHCTPTASWYFALLLALLLPLVLLLLLLLWCRLALVLLKCACSVARNWAAGWH